jgi:uncharacterized delta-60 repeat protein
MSTIRVDRITPYQSGSVAIEGLNITNLTIDGTLTASLQQGYVWVGGSGNVSTLAPTSSFGGGGGGSDITALNAFTASADGRLDNLELTSSSLQTEVNAIKLFTQSADAILVSLELATASLEGQVSSLNSFTSSQEDLNVTFATTGSNTFVGNQVISGSLTISGSSTFRNIGPTILSGSVTISGSINSDGYELEASSTTNIPALNTSFNLDFSGSESTIIKKSLVLGDGKILVAGRFESIDGHTTNDIARFNSNGTIDTSFTSPIFEDAFAGGDSAGYINTFVTQSDGKIVVGGNFFEVDGVERIGLARLNANGTLDTSFAVQSWGSIGEVRDIAIQNDGKIICVGYFTSGSRRINTDGTLDTSFNVSFGSAQPSFFNNDYFHSVALLDSGSDQAILIGGSFTQWDSFSDYTHIVKLHPSGALDFGFAGANLDITTGNSLDRIQKIKVTDAYSPGDNGYIYIAGRFKDTRTGPNVRNAGFARLTTADEGDGVGAFDSGFRTYISGSDQNLPGVSVYVNDFDFYDSDKILLGGNFITFGIPGYSTTSANRFAIISQNTGNLISGWAASGSASTYNLNTGSVNSVTLLPNDNVLVGGTFTSASSPQTAREGLASLKLTGFGNVTTTTDYSITADTTQLLISSSNTYFSGDITASTISGSFVGDGSGLTNLVLPSGVVSGSSQLTTSLDSRYLNVSGEGTISGSFTGSFVGDGSGLTGVGSSLPSDILSSSVTNFTDYSQSVDTRISSIVTGTGFAITGSNTFVGNQIVTGSLTISSSNAVDLTVVGNSVLTGSLTMSGSITIPTGSITVPGSGSFENFVANPSTMRSIRGNGAGLYNIVEQSDGNMTFTVTKIGTGDLTGAITSNISGSTINGNFYDNTTTTSGAGQQARLSGFISGGVVTSVRIETASSFLGFEEHGQPANRQGIGYKAGDTVTINQSLNQASGSLTITLRPQDIETYFGVDERVSIDYKQYGILTTRTGIISSGSISVGAGVNTLGAINGNNIAAGTDVNVTSDYSIAVGQDLYNDYINAYANATFGLHHSSSNYAQTIVGIASRLDDAGPGAFVVGNGTTSIIGEGSLTRSNLLVAQGSTVQVTGSLDVSGDGYVILSKVSSSYNFADDTAAQAGGVPLGGLYHTSGSVKIRLV